AAVGGGLLPSPEQRVEYLTGAGRGARRLGTRPVSLAGPSVAEEQGLRRASTVRAPLPFFSRFDPLRPAPAPWMHALTSRSHAASLLFRWQTERLTRKWADPVRALRRSRGLSAGDNAIMEDRKSGA